MNHQKISIFWRKLWITKEKIKLYSRLVNPFGKILITRLYKTDVFRSLEILVFYIERRQEEFSHIFCPNQTMKKFQIFGQSHGLNQELLINPLSWKDRFLSKISPKAKNEIWNYKMFQIFG